ncbi:TKL family protein kinase [Trichomonas vaginalis G3]|uniref:TKL family protein kinase n=1 Tax=Trichomonas vaginalis (strain ATCC PRA-98 / G3) TaxID=412133 RepID=A2FY37_TRIV3|nr:protein kinase protein [Trichomonas vaginalis G3]EAX90170.1 TKL family protein kinase [Trichomonas vaginalis G3]KAI5505493.1 protein kinase protein [Trichomonas vaginalis G3]|eukprot:XP_001303100.1 TKL family protein kinase [Trichomonas vaginalis G3]
MTPRTSAQHKVRKAMRALRVLSDQTAVHRKKFEFVLNQLDKFANWYDEQPENDVIAREEMRSIKKMIGCFSDFKNLLALYIIQTWTVPTLENPANFVYEQIKTLINTLRDAIDPLNHEISLNFDPESSELQLYHVYDLRAICASFAAFLQSETEDTDLINQIQNRFTDITESLALLDHTKDEGSRMFSPIPINYQQWRVFIDDFEIEEEIGHGLSAVVYKGTYKKTGEKVALKRFKFVNLNGSNLQLFQREVAVLAVLNKISHPCLIRFIGATDVPPYTIITEFMPNKSLFDDCRKNHKMSATQYTIAAYDIARGMQYLHACQIVHRDLKSLNILLDNNYKIRICDFGFAKSFNDDDTFKAQTVGTTQWMAPEILVSSHKFTSKIDVYAYGILLVELLTKKRPYPGMDDKKELAHKIVEEGLRPKLKKNTPPLLKDLITQCWDANPDVRPTFDEIVQRFENLEIYFPGTDIQAVKSYIMENRTVAEKLYAEWNSAMKNVKFNHLPLEQLAMQFYNKTLPPELVGDLWAILFETGIQHDQKYIIKLLKFFAGTSKLKESAAYLRNLPTNSVPEEVLIPYIEEIPTGSLDSDTNIIIAACKNGLASMAVIYSNSDQNLLLSLEVLASTKYNPKLAIAIADKCVKALSSDNKSLKIAAIRWLLGLKSAKRLSDEIILDLIKSDDESQRMLGYLAASESPRKIVLPELLKKIPDKDAEFACLAACYNSDLALEILNQVPFIDDLQFCAKILAISYQFMSVRKLAMNLAIDPKFKESSQDTFDLLSKVFHIKK